MANISIYGPNAYGYWPYSYKGYAGWLVTGGRVFCKIRSIKIASLYLHKLIIKIKVP